MTAVGHDQRKITWIDVAIGLLAGVAVLFGAVVAFIGLPVTTVPAQMVGEPSAPAASTQLQTSGVGWAFLLFGGVTLLGLARDSGVMTWYGAIGIAGYAGLGIFGIGAWMLPVGLPLILVLLLRTFLRHR